MALGQSGLAMPFSYPDVLTERAQDTRPVLSRVQLASSPNRVMSWINYITLGRLCKSHNGLQLCRKTVERQVRPALTKVDGFFKGMDTPGSDTAAR